MSRSLSTRASRPPARHRARSSCLTRRWRRGGGAPHLAAEVVAAPAAPRGTVRVPIGWRHAPPVGSPSQRFVVLTPDVWPVTADGRRPLESSANESRPAPSGAPLRKCRRSAHRTVRRDQSGGHGTRYRARRSQRATSTARRSAPNARLPASVSSTEGAVVIPGRVQSRCRVFLFRRSRVWVGRQYPLSALGPRLWVSADR